jgi:hypothetical protein
VRHIIYLEVDSDDQTDTEDLLIDITGAINVYAYHAYVMDSDAWEANSVPAENIVRAIISNRNR